MPCLLCVWRSQQNMNDKLDNLFMQHFQNNSGGKTYTVDHKKMGRIMYWPRDLRYRKLEENARAQTGVGGDFKPIMKNVLEEWVKLGRDADKPITADKGNDGAILSFSWKLSATGHKVCPPPTLLLGVYLGCGRCTVCGWITLGVVISVSARVVSFS